MDSLFSNAIANYVQQVSLILEAVGLTLAYVELRRPELARSLENKLDISTELFIWLARSLIPPELIPKRLPKDSNGQPTDRQKSLGVTVIKTCFLLDLIFLIVLLFGLIRPMTFLLIFIGTGSPFYLGLIAVAFALLVNALNRLGNERALGSIGLLLAAVGLVGELYQVIVICRTDGCYGFR
jgi:hypothetical protein